MIHTPFRMKKLTLTIFCTIFILLHLHSQDITRKDITGTYTWTTGEPAYTYQPQPNTFVSVPPLIYQRNTLKIRWFGKATVSTVHGMTGLVFKEKANWKIEGNTLILDLKKSKTIKTYFIDQKGPNNLCLRMEEDGAMAYQKVYKPE